MQSEHAPTGPAARLVPMPSAIRAIMRRAQWASYRRCRHDRASKTPTIAARPHIMRTGYWPHIAGIAMTVPENQSPHISRKAPYPYHHPSLLCYPRPGRFVKGPLPRSAARRSIIRWLAPGVGRAGRHGTGPVEAEKDPGEQGVQAEPPAGARPTRQPLNSTIYPSIRFEYICTEKIDEKKAITKSTPKPISQVTEYSCTPNFVLRLKRYIF